MNIVDSVLLQRAVNYDDVILFKSRLDDDIDIFDDDEYDILSLIFLGNRMNIIRYLVSIGMNVNKIIDAGIKRILDKHIIDMYSITEDIIDIYVELGMKFNITIYKPLYLTLIRKPKLLSYCLSKIEHYNSKRIIEDIYSLYVPSTSYTPILEKFNDDMIESMNILLDKGIIDVNDSDTRMSISRSFIQDIRMMDIFISKGFTFTNNEDAVLSIMTNFYELSSFQSLIYLLSHIDVKNELFNIKHYFPDTDDDSDEDDEDDNEDKHNILVYILNNTSYEEHSFHIISHILEYDIDIESAIQFMKDKDLEYDMISLLLEENNKEISLYSNLDLISSHKLIQHLQHDDIPKKLRKQIFNTLYSRSFIRKEDMNILYDMNIPSNLKEKIKKNIIPDETVNIISESKLKTLIPETNVLDNIIRFM